MRARPGAARAVARRALPAEVKRRLRPARNALAGLASARDTVASLQDEVEQLRDEVAGLQEELEAVRRRRSPMLWNETEDTIPASLGTLAEAAASVAPGENGLTAAIEYSLHRHRDNAQGPLLAALDPAVLRALIDADTLPLPPPAARERYFEGDDMSYWISGLGDRLLLEELGRRVGRPLVDGTRLLDFGSSSGRVLRHFACATPGLRAVGVDIGRHNVDWARLHLYPHVVVVQGSVLPHLPFPDGHFDCIYAGSVFTHIVDFEEAWLLELARVLSPGGFAVLTFHPERTWSEMGSDPEHWVRGMIARGPHRLDPGGIEPVGLDVLDAPMPADRVVLSLTTGLVNNANVFHSHAWIRERWGRILELDSIVPRAHAIYQDAAVLVRRP